MADNETALVLLPKTDLFRVEKSPRWKQCYYAMNNGTEN